MQAQRRQCGRQRTTWIAVIATWVSPVIRSTFAFGCAYQPQLSAYLWTTLGITIEYIIGCICQQAPPDRNELAFHFRHILAWFSCGTLSILGIVLTDDRGLLLGVRVAPFASTLDGLADPGIDRVESCLSLRPLFRSGLGGRAFPPWKATSSPSVCVKL